MDAAAAGGPESYTLDVKDGRVRINGPDQAGVFYGTRTLKQAVKSGGSAPEGTVRDAPAKPQRGLNLDIARKFYTPDWIEDRLREMADLKLNQLGLHFSDDQAFRIQSDSHPEIVSTPHLTKAQVREINALAARLHITVVPEIDSPGHLGAVLRAHPDLQLRDTQGRAVKGAVDISNPASAKLVDELLREYIPLFPGGAWHLGADEYQALVYRDPQASFPQLARAAQQRYGPSARVQDLATGWLNDRADVVRPSGKALKAWNDGFFAGGVTSAAKDIQVEYWTGKENGARPPLEYLREGRKVVNLNDEFLYYVLDSPTSSRTPPGSGSTNSGPRSCCAAPPPSRPRTGRRSWAGASPSGATWPAPRPRPRWPRASRPRWPRSRRRCGTPARPSCPGPTSRPLPTASDPSGPRPRPGDSAGNGVGGGRDQRRSARRGRCPRRRSHWTAGGSARITVPVQTAAKAQIRSLETVTDAATNSAAATAPSSQAATMR